MQVTAICMMLLTAIIPTVTADVFPGEPFNGLQVSYSVSGATLDAPADAEGFTLSRSLKGTLDGDELTVSGVATAMNGWGATLDVRVGIDGEEAKEFHEEKFPEGGLYLDPMNQPFSVTVPVPSDAKAASFTIALTGSYNAGSRGVIVEGHLDRSSSPSDPQSGDKSAKAATSDPRFKARPSKDLKLYKILQIYSQKVPKGIASSGNKNNLLTWLPYYGSKYDEFKCGGYQGKVLELLDSLKFSDDPEERALLDEWDYGPIETHWGFNHEAVVIYPKGTDWIDSGIVLDPWIDQEPKAYDIHSWAGMFSAESIIPLEAGSFHGIRGSSYYEDNPQYPTVGGDYVDPKSKKLSRAENDYVKNLPAEKREIFDRMTPQQRQTWIKMKMAEESKNGKAMGYSPLNLYLVDESGNISGFPGGVPTWQITDVSMRRFPLDDGTYWTELEYPLNRSYILVAEGTNFGEADIFMGYGMDEEDEKSRSVYMYQMMVVSGESFAAIVNEQGDALLSGSRLIEPEEIQEIDQSWLDSKPNVTAPAEYELDIEDEEIFSNNNIYGVSSNPTAPTTFAIDEPVMVTFLMNYHYRNQGGLPGIITLLHEDGTAYGPWRATGREGQGEISNAYWEVRPYIIIKPGTYTIQDSDSETWSQNQESGGRGISEVRGIYLADSPQSF